MVMRDFLGFDAAKVDALIDQGVVTDGWSPKYLPTGNPWANVAAEHKVRRIGDCGDEGTFGGCAMRLLCGLYPTAMCKPWANAVEGHLV